MIARAYLHGFASSPLSKKGLAIEGHLHERHRQALWRPDLRRPSFSELTISGALEALDAMHAIVASTASDPVRWRLIGSSLGGYLAALWAERHPERVDRLLLLCPGFDLVSRWSVILSPRNMRRWEQEGSLTFPDAQGQPCPVHWGFVVDARRYPPTPVVPCPTRIVHGRRDAIVPIDFSRDYAERHPERVTLREVDDEHVLQDSLPVILGEVDEWIA